MAIRKVKALELIMDWALWPRFEANDLDRTNINQMKDVLESGGTLPPIIVDKKSLRIIDGFHRTSAVLSLFGDDAEIDADIRDYGNETEMFLDAVRINSRQGLKLSQKDRAHVMLTLRRKKQPWPVIAEALGMPIDKMKKFFNERTATAKSGEKIPLAYGAKNLAGKKLTSKQEHYARTANGMLPIVNARLLLNALRANSYPLTPKEIEVLSELRLAIDEVLSGKEVAA